MRTHAARCTALVLFALGVAVPPAALLAQDEVADARYDAASAWVNLVMIDGDYEAAAEQVDAAVAAQLGAAQLETAVSQLESQLGTLRSLEPKEQAMERGYHKVVFDGVFDAGTFDVQVFMADDHSVAGFFVRPPGG